MKNVVNLSVHRNTVQQRKAHEIRNMFKVAAKSVVSLEGMAGYCIVAWNGNSDARVRAVSGTMPMMVCPEFVKQQIAAAIRIEE